MDLGAVNVKRKRGRPSLSARNDEPREERVSKRKRVEPSKSSAAQAPAIEEMEQLPQGSPSKKRKRGRPSNASVSERTQDEREEPSSSRPTRKERVNYSEKRKYGGDNQEKVEEARGSREKRRVDYSEKRRHSSSNQKEGEEPSSRGISNSKHRVDKGISAPSGRESERAENISHPTGKKSKAGRPQKSSQAETVEQEGEHGDPKADRASKRKQTAISKPSGKEVPHPPPKKRGRPSLNGVDQVASAKVQSTLDIQSKRRGRPSNTSIVENEDEQNRSESGPPKKRRGRPSNADDTATSSKIPVENAPIQKKRVAPQEEHSSVPEATHKEKRRRRSSPDPEEEEIDQHTEIAHQRLVPREHKINRDIIDTKWNSLPPGAISRVSSILNEAQRPVMHRLHNEQTRTQAQSAISAIVRKVERKLTKGFPFPPSTRASHREDDFDLEKILRHNRGLEGQLTVLHHSNELLIADRKKEEELLEREKKMLKKLEAGVKEDESFNKAEFRKTDHPLLKKSFILGGNKDEIALANMPRVDLSDLQQDEDLEPVIRQMEGHLESMQGNMEQIKDIGSAITESRAAVEDALFKHIDTDQYERVVMAK